MEESMPTLALGATAALGLLTVAAIMAWKRRQAQQWFAAGGQLPEAGKGEAQPGTWQPTYDDPGYSAEAMNPARPDRAQYILPEGRFVRGLDMNRRTSAGVVTPHWGIDLAAPVGMPVYAAKGGTVIRAEPISGYGNAVVIRHDDGQQSTLYGHLNSMAVRPDMQVHGGQVIGEVGRTTAGPDGVVPSWGRSMAAHLHMEVHPTPNPSLTRTSRRLDPVRWLQQEGIDQYESRWQRA
jgi:murein DD-endopeptidase MepM/ murein hydrolase activator NlpD